MGDVGFVDVEAAASAHSLDIATVEAPIALCTDAGWLQVATAPAMALLRRVATLDDPPSPVPPELWRLLERNPTGDAVEWRPPGARQEVLGFTRYYAARGLYVILMREVSAKKLALSERLQQQRIDTTERLVASIAHDIRSSVASVVYSADFLHVSGSSIAPGQLSETVRDLAKASASLQLTVDALLDYAHLGPSVSVAVPLREALNRALGSLRNHYLDGSHRVRMDVTPRAEWVKGNPIVIEQILVNLLLNSVEASPSPRCVIVTAFPTPPPDSRRVGEAHYVCIRVWDDGPGIAPDLRPFVFDPFFTTKQSNPGLGLAIARQAAESLDGALELTDDDSGTCFSLYLPGCEGTP